MSTETTKDFDISILSAVKQEVSTHAMHLIVTGGHAIAALTGEYLVNPNDMDTNIYSERENKQALGITHQFINDTFRHMGLSPIVIMSDDRLVYKIPFQDSNGLRDLEIEFYRISDVCDQDGLLKYSLVGKNGQVFQVPTTLAVLQDSNSTDHEFRVKSLQYAVATWMLRISGSALNPKREIRESDLIQLGQLLRVLKKEDYEKVLLEIRQHPQFPIEEDEVKIFKNALSVLEKHQIYP